MATAVTTARHDLDDWLRLMRAEFIEMPGLRLSVAQAQRLWGLERARCEALLAALVDARFLWRDSHGCYSRFDVERVTG
jgi:DNA-binding IclR family transcriptional regulator